MAEFGEPTDYSSELKRIVKAVKSLRNMKSGKTTVWQEAAECHMKYSNLHGNAALSLTVTLSPTGCDWARRGGCTMCGEFEGSLKRPDLLANPEFHIAQFAAAVTDPRVAAIVEREGVPVSWLRIYQEGNYTNIHEMSIQAQRVILRLALQLRGVRRVTIESRPEYVTPEAIHFLSEIFDGSGVELEVGMGLEAKDRVVRNVCINKQGGNEEFARAARLLKDSGFSSLAYVLLKPPFLTELEAIEEAVETSHFAADIGFDRISFEPMSIHNYTLVDALSRSGDYAPPWLWSVVEVAKRCADIADIFGIGGVGYYPIPATYCANRCENDPDCSEAFGAAIMDYNRSRDVRVFDRLACDCHSAWEAELREVPDSLHERMSQQLGRAERLIPNYAVDSTVGDMRLRNQRVLMSYSQ
jgi:radical SAM enzyme (TIGR01210 family)